MYRQLPAGNLEYKLRKRSHSTTQDEEMFVDEREQSKTSNDHPSLPIISYIIKEEVQVEEDYDDIVDGEAEQWVS